MSAKDRYIEVFSTNSLLKLLDEFQGRKRAVGTDGVTMNGVLKRTDSEISIINKHALEGKRRFSRYRPKVINKGPNKLPRVVCIPTIRDQLFLKALNSFLASELSDCYTAKPYEYISKIRDHLLKFPDSVFVRMDIESFYPSINHEILLRKLKRTLPVDAALISIASAISTGFEKKNPIIAHGVPQGLSVSNTICNFYLKSVDEFSETVFPDSVLYLRYVDDVLVLCPEHVAESIFQTISFQLQCLSLRVHPIQIGSGKSEISSSMNGVDYLGFRIKRNDISVRDSSVKKFHDRIINMLTAYKKGKLKEDLIWKLNLKITGCVYNGVRYGWVHFFSSCTNPSQFYALDAFLRKTMEKITSDIDASDLKRFSRAFYCIKYQSSSTLYIPNFDKYDVFKKKIELKKAFGMSDSKLAEFDDDAVNKMFDDLMKKQIIEMEKDEQDTFS